MRYLLFSIFSLSALAADLSKEIKLSLQVAELEMQLSQAQYENLKLSQKLLEVAFKNSQAKHADLQIGACQGIGGKVKEDCEFTADTVLLKPKPSEVKEKGK